MKNKLSDLNNHLFAALERLGDEELDGDALKAEIERSRAISGVARDIVSNAALQVRAAELYAEHGVLMSGMTGIEHKGKGDA